MFTERIQVLLTADQRRQLERRAQDEHRSLGAIIREAIDAYVRSAGRSRVDAAEHLLALEAPVDDWKAIKGEIERDILEGALLGR